MAKINIDREHIKPIFDHYSKEDSILVTSDGNTFLNNPAGKNYCRDHCKRTNATFAVLTRSEFEAGAASAKVKKSSSKTGEESAKGASAEDNKSDDWRTKKWDDMVAFATENGLTPETKMNQGKEALITEIEAFLAAKESGANATTNHTEE